MSLIWGRLHTVTLPSGMKVGARRISLMSLLWAGGFPTELTSVVWSMFNQGVDVKQLSQEPDGLRRMVGIIEAVVPHVLVQPKVLTPQEVEGGKTTTLEVGADGVQHGAVALGDIPDVDKQWLFLFGQALIRTDEERDDRAGAPAGPGGFRAERVRADAGPGGAAVRPAAVADPGAAAGEPAGAGP